MFNEGFSFILQVMQELDFVIGQQDVRGHVRYAMAKEAGVAAFTIQKKRTGKEQNAALLE